jgi:hypothetical protein
MDGTTKRTHPVNTIITNDTTNHMSDTDWGELRAFLKTRCKEHDERKAYTEEHLGLSLIVDMMIDMYEAGRRHTIPDQWRDAHQSVVARRDPAFQAYLQRKAEVIRDRAKYERLETLDMHQLTDGPMHKFLAKKQKTITTKK